MNSKKIKALLLAAMMLLSMVLLTACGGSSDAPAAANASGEIEYKVTVTDSVGTPYTTGVIVRFLKDGQQAAMQPVDETGSAAKTMAAGEYAVELMFTGNEDEYHYNKEGLTVTADAPELNVVLTYTMRQEPSALTVQGQQKQAYPVSDGSTYVDLVPGERSYFLYTPTMAGTYAFSSDTEGAVVGYYGAPHFVQENSAAEVTDNTFTQSIRADMIGDGSTGTTVLVIGIDADENTSNCVLSIQRIGDPEWNVADEPWTVYAATVELAPYTLPSGSSLVDFDLTASTDAYTLVLGSDGFYHLNSENGPLVLVKLGVDGQYLDCFKTILDHTGVNKYFYGEAGEFVKKESYSECLLEYIANMDEDNGVYPLTEDLKYIIQQAGDHNGWFDPSNGVYLFVDKNFAPIAGINNEISWLFMCCYIAN